MLYRTAWHTTVPVAGSSKARESRGEVIVKDGYSRPTLTARDIVSAYRHNDGARETFYLSVFGGRLQYWQTLFFVIHKLIHARRQRQAPQDYPQEWPPAPPSTFAPPRAVCMRCVHVVDVLANASLQRLRPRSPSPRSLPPPSVLM